MPFGCLDFFFFMVNTDIFRTAKVSWRPTFQTIREQWINGHLDCVTVLESRGGKE